MSNTVRIVLWGTTIGYLHQDQHKGIGFQYDEDFISSGIEISPITMPLRKGSYFFPALNENTYHGLPGLVADSLPDRFGNIVLKRYLESQGRDESSMSVMEKLCYTGRRGMGALEYEPATYFGEKNISIDLDALTKLASDILSQKENFHLAKNDHLMEQLMESGSSVGGARAKTLIAWNPKTNDIRSGQISAGKGYEYWLLKFDNIENNRDKESIADKAEYTKIEYAYYLMAKAAGIKMNECRLYKESGNTHFMTKRFDRVEKTGDKIHMQSLCALAHMDFNSARTNSYEEAFRVMSKLHLPQNDFLQLFSRMVFNHYAKNFDDHTKNISFLMNKRGVWSLSPAYDITYAFNPKGQWTRAHQMLINGKADEITASDLYAVARNSNISKDSANEIIERVKTAIDKWHYFAGEAELSKVATKEIQTMISPSLIY